MSNSKKFFCKFTLELSENDMNSIRYTWKRLGRSEASLEEILRRGGLMEVLSVYRQSFLSPPIKDLKIHSFDDHEGLG